MLIFSKRFTDCVGSEADLLALSGDLQHIHDTDTKVASAGQAAEREYVIIAELLHKLSGHTHEFGGLGERDVVRASR